jgi:hypothetical protein
MDLARSGRIERNGGKSVVAPVPPDLARFGRIERNCGKSVVALVLLDLARFGRIECNGGRSVVAPVPPRVASLPLGAVPLCPLVDGSRPPA